MKFEREIPIGLDARRKNDGGGGAEKAPPPPPNGIRVKPKTKGSNLSNLRIIDGILAERLSTSK